MSQQLPFTKVEGLGNDFVVVDLRARAGSKEAAAVQDPELVRKVCDRHFGVGGDGILAILPGTSGDARMRVLNADGSEAEMCGNGIRCVAKVLYESDPALRKAVIKIDTGAGLLACEIPLAPGGASRVTRESIVALDRTFRFTAVSMGNPHAVIFVDDASEDLMALAKKYGPALETAPTFPRRTNVEFARVRKDGEIDLVVWERGCGITLACGTGACATGVAAAVEERLPRGREILVHLPGGPLGITVAPDDSGVRMRGPAKTVFRSELDLAALGPRSA
jgi:diaminopimelate epimerase